MVKSLYLVSILVTLCHLVAFATGYTTNSLPPPTLRLVSKPQLNADKSTIHFTAEYKNIPFAKSTDYIGVYPCFTAECTEPISTKSPIQYKLARPPKGYNNTGTTEPPQTHLHRSPHGTLEGLVKGRVEFTVLVRSAVVGFVLAYEGGSSQYSEIFCTSKVIPIEYDIRNIPRQIRLSLVSGDESAMRVMWTMPEDRGVDMMSVVYTNTRSGKSRVAKAIAVYRYTAEGMCDTVTMPAGTSGFVSGGLQYEVIMDQLVPDEKYVYCIVGYCERTYSFVAPDRAKNQDVTMLVFGDMGQSLVKIDGQDSRQHSFDYGNRGEIHATETATSIERIVERERVGVINHIGDISYATGQLSLWQNFLLEVSATTQQVPWMTAIGNHEIGYSKSFFQGQDSQGECGIVYTSLFPFAMQHNTIQYNTTQYNRNARMSVSQYTGEYRTNARFLSQLRGSEMEEDVVLEYNMIKEFVNLKAEKSYYSYDIGVVHVAVISTEHDFRIGSEQYNWLKNDLSTSDRLWRIVLGHRPMYVDAKFPAKDSELLRKHLEPLLVKYKVQIYMAGHHHSYQRTCPTINYNCVSAGPIHITTGNAGYAHSPFSNPQNNTTHDKIYIAKNNVDWGINKLEFVNKTRCIVSFIRNTDDSVLDSITITI